MKTKFIIQLIIAFLIFSVEPFNAQTDEGEIKSFVKSLLNDVSFSGQWFLSYQKERVRNVSDNEFLLKRGYITFNKNLTKTFRLE
jgi:hypothetical protein